MSVCLQTTLCNFIECGGGFIIFYHFSVYVEYSIMMIYIFLINSGCSLLKDDLGNLFFPLFLYACPEFRGTHLKSYFLIFEVTVYVV